MIKKPHRVVIRTTEKHQTELRSLAEGEGTSLSELVRGFIKRGIKTWKADVFQWIPDHDLVDEKTAILQVRMPDRLFRALERIVDDLEYTRTDLYLRLIELGRGSDVETRT